MARIPLADLDPDDPILEPLHAYFADREPPAIYRVLANAPRLLRAWVDLAWPLRNEVAAPRGLRELAIMRVAQLTGAETEWAAHRPLAESHGVSPDQLAELDHWRDSGHFDAAEAAYLAFTDQMTLAGSVDDETFRAMHERWAPQEIVELTLTVAFYCCVSRVLLALEIEPPA